MTKEEIIAQATRIAESAKENPLGAKAEAEQFLETYASGSNSFLENIRKLTLNHGKGGYYQVVSSTLESFITYVKNDLLRTVSLEREIQIETVSDYLDQAENLLSDNRVHPAAPAVIIGASLEEFLRSWLVAQKVDITTITMSLDSYAQELRKMDLITKQDIKDITSWGGTRNDAAHGHWENVKDRNRIKLMLEGVNLFMRKYSV
jgi:hypothetical protein